MSATLATPDAAPREDRRTRTRPPVPLDGLGDWLLFAVPAGFGLGVALTPFARQDGAGALIAFGALLIAAVALRCWLQAKAHVDELEQKLLDEASYHAFVDSAIEGFFRTTRDGRYVIVNRALANIYGYDSPKQLIAEMTDIGGSLYVDPGRRAEFEATMAADGMVQDFVSRIRRRDGRFIWIAENARTVRDEDGQFLFYEGTVEDVTARREAVEVIERALKETQEAARAKAAFLAAMSHELKTPLNAVIGFSDLMRHELYGPVNDARYRAYIADIHDNGQRLLALINDILDLSRAEGGLIELEEELVCVAEMIAEGRRHAKDAAARTAIAIAADGHLPLLRADRRRLEHMIAHLVSNAAKFTPENGVIRIAGERANDGGVVLRIEDSGIGMAPEQIRHALEPFKQLDGRIERRFEGAGVGLPLVRAFAELHGARLAIASAPGVGTTVTLHFPPERSVARSDIAAA